MRVLKQLYPQLAQDFAGNHVYNFQKDGKNIILHPKEQHNGTLIWLHGLGDNADNYLGLFNNPQVTPLAPDIKVILPTAPERPLTKNNGEVMTSWFDIKQSDWGSQYGNVPTSQLLGIDQAQESRQYIESLIVSEINILNGDSKKIFIGGFSQGCAMALLTGLTLNYQIGGILGFSGFSFDFDQKEESINTPVLISHGLQDQRITWEFAQKSYKNLKNQEIIYHPIEDAEHNLNFKSFDLIKQFTQIKL